MTESTESPVSFGETETRSDEMDSTIEQWVEDLTTDVDEAAANAEFQEWLDVQSRFHDYSHRNTLLIKLQCPEASRVAGYNTWRNEFDRHVQEGESAIWIWAPIITKQCPECENSPNYHENSDCEYDETPPEEWSKGLVGFKPASVFDISQTDGEPLPDLETEATGDASDLVPALLESADSLGVEPRIVPPEEWSYGEAKGVCKRRSVMTMRPRVEVKDRENRADLASTLIHEYAHTLLHFEVEDDTERSKRELEAEAIAYVVGRYFGLDMTGRRSTSPRGTVMIPKQSLTAFAGLATRLKS